MQRRLLGTSNVIGVLSGKGGVGKTTVVANLGAALASEFNKNVLVIDGNVRTSHLGFHLGLYEELPATLREVMAEKVPVMEAIFLHPASGLRLLPAPMKGDADLERINNVIKDVRAVYDPILLDCAPGLGEDVVLAVKAIDKAILVTTPELPSLTDTLKTIDLLERFEKDIIGIVLNRVRKEKYELSIEEIESACEYNVIGVISEENKIPESIAEGVPLVMSSGCAAAVEFKRLAANLIGKEYHPPGLWYKLKNLFSIPIFPLRKPSEMEREEREEMIKEDRVAIEELKSEIIIDLEKDIMERIKEKLREKLSERSEK